MTGDSGEVFERARPVLFGLAYRMLGSAEEAEDVVQDTFLRWHHADGAGVRSASAWLAKVASNLCLNRLSSARVRRAGYVGPWLPEPVPTAGGVLGPLDTVERRDSVSLALLVLLERLSPVERAVFVLREAFGYSHREVAEAVEVSEANSRQLYRRARQRIADVAGGSGKTPGTVGLTGADTDADPARRQELVERFLAAAEEGELPALERMLAEDVTVWVDGGGRVSAALRPVTGAARVARYLIGAAGAAGRSVRLSAVEVNGVPGAFASVGGDLVGVLVPEPVGERIGGLRIVTNPEKLGFAARLSPPGARLSHSAGLSGS